MEYSENNVKEVKAEKTVKQEVKEIEDFLDFITKSLSRLESSQQRISKLVVRYYGESECKEEEVTERPRQDIYHHQMHFQVVRERIAKIASEIETGLSEIEKIM